MKLEIGIPDYPYQHPILCASLRGRKADKPVPLYVVTMAEMEALHERLPNMRATPAYAAYDADKKRVWLHPLPSGEFHLDIDPDVLSPEPAREEAAPTVDDTVPAKLDRAPAPDKGRFSGTISKEVARAFGKKV